MSDLVLHSRSIEVEGKQTFAMCNIDLWTFLPAKLVNEWVVTRVLPPERDILWEVSSCDVTRSVTDGVTGYHIELNVRDMVPSEAFPRFFRDSPLFPFLKLSSIRRRSDRVQETVYTGSLEAGSPPSVDERVRLRQARCEEEMRQTDRDHTAYAIVYALLENPELSTTLHMLKTAAEAFDVKGGTLSLTPFTRDEDHKYRPFPIHVLNEQFRTLTKDFLVGELSSNGDVSAVSLRMVDSPGGLTYSCRMDAQINIRNKTTLFFSPSFTGELTDDVEPVKILKRCEELGIMQHIRRAKYILWAYECLIKTIVNLEYDERPRPLSRVLPHNVAPTYSALY